MKQNVTQQLIHEHLVEGSPTSGEEIALRIDQTLTQDATGTLVMLELEAMQIPRVQTELSAQYVDHNLLQVDARNADDHRFLRSACRKFGVRYSGPGNGISHVVHMERFGIPGRTLLGSDSHTPAAGSLGMLAIGAGGIDVALAMAGRPFRMRMPRIRGVRLVGTLRPWVSAKDIILEMLRRHGVAGGVGKVIEYYGPGLNALTAMDRHVIANMGAELGATTSVFPSDRMVRAFLAAERRERDWRPLAAEPGATYDEDEEIDLSRLEPLIACPSSPGRVRPVREVAGLPIAQSYIGSSANPGLRDFAVPAMVMRGRHVAPGVSLDINPTSRQVLEAMAAEGYLSILLAAGARLHQTGCNGCIGMGQAPGTGRISVRTVPRNFPGRSGTPGDAVYLASPETAIASAMTGVITDPRTLDIQYPVFVAPEVMPFAKDIEIPPETGDGVQLEKGPNIGPLPQFDPLPDRLDGPVLLKVGNDVSTDEILPAGARVLPFRSNIPEISRFSFSAIDATYYDRAQASRRHTSFVVGGSNYGQGSSREHAALAPRFLGLRAVLARSFARIHLQNLVNFGILPLRFVDPADWDQVHQGDILEMSDLHEALRTGDRIVVHNRTRHQAYRMEHTLTSRHVEIVLAGGLIGAVKAPA